MTSPTKVMALNHKTGMLALRHGDQPMAEFIYMKEVHDPVKFLKYIAKPLSRKCRFAGQLTDDAPEDWSVLHHSLVCGQFAFDNGRTAKEVLHCLMHDIGEAFYVDVPSPFKTAENEKIEAAIVRATPYKWLCPFMEKTHSGLPGVDFNFVHDIDKLCGIVEAKMYGNNWDWPKEAAKGFSRKQLSTMKAEIEIISGHRPDHAMGMWTDWVTILLKEYHK
jgi:hypothetical protein